MRRYYWRWLKTAFNRALGVVDLWSGVAGAVITLLAHLLPEWRDTLNGLVWQVPLWSLATVMLVRLFLAPYWMWLEDDKKIRALTLSAASRQQRAQAASAKVEAFEDILSRGQKIYEQWVLSDQDYATWRERYESWRDKAASLVRTHEGHRALGLFQRQFTITSMFKVENAWNGEHNSDLARLRAEMGSIRGYLESALDEKRAWDAENISA